MTKQTNEIIAQHPNYQSEIIEIIKSRLTPKLVKEKLLAYHENDIAEAMNGMSAEERTRLYHFMDAQTLANILEYSENINSYIDELNIRKKIDVLSNLEISLVADYLKNTERLNRQTILDLIDGDVKAELRLISSFDDDEIGSRLTTNFISVKSGLSIDKAMESLVVQAKENDSDNINTIYVVDSDNAFVGAVDLKDLIISDKSTLLKDVTVTSYPYVYANELIEDCIERIKDYSEDSIPVLDSDNRIVGVLLSQDITELVDDILGDDYAKLAGLSVEEDLHEPIKKSVSKRLPWLAILLGLGLVVSTVVGLFESVVSHLTLIVCFQSLILDMAGNVGTQSLAVTIRVLMDEQLSARQRLGLVAKELRVGLANGLILGVLSFVFIALYITMFKGQTLWYAGAISICTGAAMLISIVLSSITGTVIPIMFKKFKIDPAVASGPLITTLNDLVAVIAYYGLAWVFLIDVLGL